MCVCAYVPGREVKASHRLSIYNVEESQEPVSCVRARPIRAATSNG